MVLPASPNSISFAQIRNEFYNQSAFVPFVGTISYGTNDANLYNVNYYRGKFYYIPATDSYALFSTGQLDFNTFRGKQANCQCACDCACDCGNGGDGGF